MSVSSPAGSPPDVGVVIVAAGSGVRAGPGGPKQFRPIGGVPMLLRALQPFLARRDVGRVVVTLPTAVAEQPPAWLQELLGARVGAVTGGATRADSVRAGLQALGVLPSVVLVHDAARPFVDATTIGAVIEHARAGVGAVAAVPMGDTVKDVADDGRVVRTVERIRLWRAQTPQGFPGAMLAAGYARWPAEGPPPTDDAEAVERAGFPVEVVAGSALNLKVTTEDDWRLAEALARELG
jgi:2-C-methyl-D-erythritol 4-phosphate cytidylyltransferase